MSEIKVVTKDAAVSTKGALHSNPFVYGTAKTVLFILYKAFFRFEHSGVENVPSESDARGVILAPNHESYLDPPLLGISLGRRVTYLAKEYLFRAFFVGWFLRTIGALPIKSETDDFRSIRQLVRSLKERNCVVIFPEGTRTEDGNLKPAESGIGFIALKSRSAVVPVYIDGTFEAFPKDAKFFRPKKVRVFYGKPFVPADDPVFQGEGAYQAVADKIMAEIKILKEHAINT